MGATTFSIRASGKSAEEAFRSAVRAAQWEHGHGGYTGTIAEKNDFVVIAVPEGKDPNDYAHELIDNDDPRIVDKWGPAGAIKLDANQWLFFGWASE